MAMPPMPTPSGSTIGSSKRPPAGAPTHKALELDLLSLIGNSCYRPSGSTGLTERRRRARTKDKER